MVRRSGELRRDVVVPRVVVPLIAAWLLTWVTFALDGSVQSAATPMAALLLALPTLLAVGAAALVAARMSPTVRAVPVAVRQRAVGPLPLPRASHPDCAGHVRARAPGRHPA